MKRMCRWLGIAAAAAVVLGLASCCSRTTVTAKSGSSQVVGGPQEGARTLRPVRLLPQDERKSDVLEQRVRRLGRTTSQQSAG